MPVYTGDKFGFGKGPSGSDGAPASAGEAFFPEPGQFDWVCPAGVTSVCAVCIGGGGGSTRDEMGGSGGGGLGYKNNISVTPGNTYKVQVGSGGVGYKIEEIVLEESIQKISATEIRRKMREEGKLK